MKTSPIGQEFYFCTGVVVNNVQDLIDHIKGLSEPEYGHHVNQDKNDFYNWIYYCIDKKTGNKIKGNLDRNTLVNKLTVKPVKKAGKKSKQAKKTVKKARVVKKKK